MADAFSTNNRFCKPEVGADDGTWGTLLNTQTIDMIDEAVGGYVAVSVASGNVTLSANDGTTDQARNAVIKFTGSPGTDRTVTAPVIEKTYWLINGVGDSSNILFKAAGGSTVTIPAGFTAKVYTDGTTTAVILFLIPTGGTGVSLTATQTLTNKTLTSPTIATPTISGTATLSGGQLAFPASQSASANANTLDDYEEGTFTPAAAFGGGTTGITYAANGQVGSYTKIGNRVLFQIHVLLTSNGSSTGAFTVTGLPFTSNSTTNAYSSLSVIADGLTGISGHLQANIAPNATVVTFTYLATGTAVSLSDTTVTDSALIIVGGQYSV